MTSLVKHTPTPSRNIQNLLNPPPPLARDVIYGWPLINLERTIIFVFNFCLKIEPRGRLILIKNFYWNRFFVQQKCPLEITSPYAWQPLLCLVKPSCYCKTSFQLIQTSFMASENHSLLFFSDITTTKSNFYIQRKHFFQRILYDHGQWKLIFCLVETVCFSFGASFLLLETMIQTRGINFERKIFSCQWKLFPIFCQRKQFFRLAETYFLTNPSFHLMKKDFLFKGSHLLYIRVPC